MKYMSGNIFPYFCWKRSEMRSSQSKTATAGSQRIHHEPSMSAQVSLACICLPPHRFPNASFQTIPSIASSGPFHRCPNEKRRLLLDMPSWRTWRAPCPRASRSATGPTVNEKQNQQVMTKCDCTLSRTSWSFFNVSINTSFTSFNWLCSCNHCRWFAPEGREVCFCSTRRSGGASPKGAFFHCDPPTLAVRQRDWTPFQLLRISMISMVYIPMVSSQC